MRAVSVAVCPAGAQWFSTQQVAGQETKQLIYRPGLRNNFGGRRLSAEELDLALAQKRVTNLMKARFHGSLSSNVCSSERIPLIVRSPFSLADQKSNRTVA
jgi:hypothetical protein